MRPSLALTLVVAAACGGDASNPNTAWRDASPHKRREIRVAESTTIAVLDWGGTGTPLIFLAGIGNSAHVFDSMAPLFTDRFHVFGISRRGFGGSSQPPAATIPPLVQDIKTVLDSLALGPAVLVGHSFAGVEMTAVAADHPEACRGLIYLDAAHNHERVPDLMREVPMPAPPVMTASDSASVGGVQGYLKLLTGVVIPENELRAVMIFDSAGRYVGDIVPDSVTYRVVASVPRKPYARITCPALAIYAVSDSSNEAFPFWDALDSAGQAAALRVLAAGTRWRRESMDQFGREMAGGRIVEIPNAQHYLFLSHPDVTIRAMRHFLDSLPPK